MAGTIFEDAVEECITRGINTWRVDISAMLSGMVMNNKATKDLFQNQYGRREIELGLPLFRWLLGVLKSYSRQLLRPNRYMVFVARREGHVQSG